MMQKENPAVLFLHEAHRDRLIIRYLLQYCNFEVTSATVEHLFGKIDEMLKVDLIVFDFVYDVKLLEYCRRLKTGEKTRHTPLIVIIANPQITRAELNKFPIDEIIRAPVDIKELEEFFKEYFRKLSDRSPD